jgi:hypothetical protein
MECRLQIFKNEYYEGHSGWAYRFVVVDSSKSKSYPANFVCMLPLNMYKGRSNSSSVFRELFGDKCFDLAIGLLSDALKNEKDAGIKTEIEKRLKLLNPKDSNSVKCNNCSKVFQPRKTGRYKQNLCETCLNSRYLAKKT